MLISLEDLSFGYDRDNLVLSSVNFAIFSSSRVALLGPNGAGKTTLLELMMGLLKPLQGRIIAFGSERKTERDFREVRRKIGLIFQDPDDQVFCPTVIDDVAFGPLNLGFSPKEADEMSRLALCEVGLCGYENRVTYRLSYGEKRLVTLASVFVMKPSLLLLDEPTNGLDEASWARVCELLRKWPGAMLVASHDKALLSLLSLETWKLEHGRLENVGV